MVYVHINLQENASSILSLKKLNWGGKSSSMDWACGFIMEDSVWFMFCHILLVDTAMNDRVT